MKNKFTLTLVAIIALISLSFTTISKLPKNWFVAGSMPKSYEMKTDNSTFYSGNSAVMIRSIDKKIKGFGTVMQSCSAEAYLGTKIKLTGMLKTEDVKKWAGLWLRVDDANGKVLSFDNMRKTKLKGTNDWQQYEIILNVPENAKTLNFGGLLVGTGTLWFDDLKFEVIKDRKAYFESLSKTPKNLSFEE